MRGPTRERCQPALRETTTTVAVHKASLHLALRPVTRTRARATLLRMCQPDESRASAGGGGRGAFRLPRKPRRIRRHRRDIASNNRALSGVTFWRYGSALAVRLIT